MVIATLLALPPTRPGHAAPIQRTVTGTRANRGALPGPVTIEPSAPTVETHSERTPWPWSRASRRSSLDTGPVRGVARREVACAALETDATIDRTLLTERAYADSANLRSRQSIYDFRDGTGDWFAWVLDHADWPAAGRVLDVGCGPGSYLERVRGVGLDLSAGMAREARRHAPTIVGDVCRLPVALGSSDR